MVFQVTVSQFAMHNSTHVPSLCCACSPVHLARNKGSLYCWTVLLLLHNILNLPTLGVATTAV